MATKLVEGRLLIRSNTPVDLRVGPSGIRGQIFFLTNCICASFDLDEADCNMFVVANPDLIVKHQRCFHKFRSVNFSNLSFQSRHPFRAAFKKNRGNFRYTTDHKETRRYPTDIRMRLAMIIYHISLHVRKHS